jgi:hypothetical protein
MFSSNHLGDGKKEERAVVLLTKTKASGHSFHINQQAAAAAAGRI